jgi:transcriptional regulator with XRE-family HTH domain
MPRSTSTEAYAVMVGILLDLRQRAGLTQGQLANRIGKPQAFISTVERGARRIDVIEFCVLARALKQDPVELFARVVRELPDDIDI